MTVRPTLNPLLLVKPVLAVRRGLPSSRNRVLKKLLSPALKKLLRLRVKMRRQTGR